jgi:hypothetical protein
VRRDHRRDRILSGAAAGDDPQLSNALGWRSPAGDGAEKRHLGVRHGQAERRLEDGGFHDSPGNHGPSSPIISTMFKAV